ncbi:NB-ARC domain-containing protein [Leptolyngbya boryana CZ1]|uniref:NB-ARC domain-containing protein n=1 Tax=Leptolyngbya boryana CZ1 TaxID=3060204 RepID=A0AA97ARA5_LEPBY|nr:NB-ARC domain-containing protein [Leptolyngbya boryana]WNZ46404.1 NB-ARC domain-containing protein [Leptolyngbya boryana CZ1]
MGKSSKSTPNEYDPVTDYHYLKFENRCLRASGDDFQNLFEAILVRARPGEFERVRPYGKYGDRKCDGLIESEGIIFQVYSPDELKQAEVQKKIDEDLEGAVQHWRGILKKWVFVYNIKRGIAADIKLTLQQKRQQYPDIEIDCWSNDYLWEIVHGLTLQQRCELLGAPPQWDRGKPKKNFYVPNPPIHLLERSTDLGVLKNLLLSSSSLLSGIAGSTSKVSLHGMGGIGKSVLAGMLARDEEVQAAFPDGVFWIPLGQEPTLTLKQLNFAQMLGDASLTFQDVQQGKIHLSQLLNSRECLLILDDVWQVEHVAAFDVLSEQSKLLFTTRDSRIVKALNAIEYQVNPLNGDQALELLATCSGHAKEALPVEAHEIMQECGNLPSALSMIGAIAKARPNRWANLLSKLKNADLEKIRYHFPDYPYPDLLKVIQVSVDALEPEVRIRYLDFAVFPEDVAIPEATLRTFWEPEGLNEYDTQDVIDMLVERSLARRDAIGYLTLHDLQYDYVRRQSTDLPKLHNRLLDAYAIHCPQGWHTFPQNDGYFFEYLTYHLKSCNRENELFSLLVGSPAWMEAKSLACSGHESYVIDIERALKDFTDPLEPDQIVMLVQLHLAKRVVNHYVDYYSNTDLKTLVWLGREVEALNHARLRSPFDGRLAIFNALKEKGQIEFTLIDEAWKLLESASKYEERIAMLCQLVPILAETGRVQEANSLLSEIESFAWEAEDDEDGELDPRLSNLGVVLAQIERADEAEEILKRIEYEGCQADVLKALAEAFAKNGYVKAAMSYLDESLDAVITAGSCESNYEEWVSILVLMSEVLATYGYFSDAEEFVRLQEDSLVAVLAFSKLALINHKAGRYTECNTLFSEVLEIIPEIKVKVHRSWAFSDLALALSKVGCKSEAVENLSQAMKALSIEDNYKVAEMRRELAVSLAMLGLEAESRAVFYKAKESVQKVEEQRRQSILLRNIAVSLAQSGYREEAYSIFASELETSENLEELYERGWMMTELAQAMAISGYKVDAANILTKVKEILAVIEERFEKERLTEYLLSALTKSFCFSEAKEIIQANAEKPVNKFNFIELAKAMVSAKEFTKAEEFIQTINEEWCREWASRYLVAGLARSGQFEKASKIARSLKRDLDKAQAMREFSVALAQAQYFDEAEEISNLIEFDFYQAETLIELATVLSQNGFLEEAERIFRKAREIISLIESISLQQEILKKLALALCKAKLFSQGFYIWVSTIEGMLREIDDFLLTLFELVEAFEKIQVGLSQNILREAIRIAGWVHPSWQEIYELFQK